MTTISHHVKAGFLLLRISLFCISFSTPLFCAGMARFRYINAYGERLGPSEYYYASDFSCGFGIAQSTNGEWVVVDSAGNEKGTGIFSSFRGFQTEPYFSEGVAMLYGEDADNPDLAKTFAIGTDASILFTLDSKPFGPFCHGVALVLDGMKVIPIDFAGQVLHTNQYDWAMLFRDSTMGHGLRYGMKRGTEETFLFDGLGHETKFGQGWQIGAFAGSFYAEYGESKGAYEDRRIRIHSADGRVLFKRDSAFRVNWDSRGEGLFGFIHFEADRRHVFFVDLAGREVLAGTDTNKLSAICAEGMIRFCDKVSGLHGYVDRTGARRIVAQFLEAGNFSEGLAWVVDKNGELGYIDTRGKKRIATGCKVRLPWNDGRDFHEGIAVIPAQ